MADNQKTIEAKALSEAFPGDVEVLEEHGAVLAATVIVVCSGCSTLLVGNLSNEHPEDPDWVATEDLVCPVCTEQAGKPVVVQVGVLAGNQVALLDALEDPATLAAIASARPAPAAVTPERADVRTTEAAPPETAAQTDKAALRELVQDAEQVAAHAPGPDDAAAK